MPFPGNLFPPRIFPEAVFSQGWALGTAEEGEWWEPDGADSVDPFMRFWYTDEDGAWVEADFQDDHLVVDLIAGGYSSPTRCEFRVFQPQHTTPIPHRAWVVVVDESYGYFDTPVFEGRVDQIIPAASNEVKYVAYDATRSAAHEVFVMSQAWTNDEPEGLQEGIGAIPHVVFNVKETDQDEEFAYARDNDASLETIITALLDDALAYLQTLFCAPPPGADEPEAYEPDDLDELTQVPQTKVTFSNETIRGAVERVLQFDPKHKIKFVYGHSSRKWRVHNIMTAPATTLTLNDANASKVVMSLNLIPSADRRYTATKIYGPPKTVIYNATTTDGTLAQTWTGGQGVSFNSLGPNGNVSFIGDAGKVWQITDATKRQLATRLPTAGFIPKENTFGTTQEATRQPTLVASWDDGDTWEVIRNTTMDRSAGKVIATNRVYRYNSTTGEYDLPTNVRFLCAYFAEPLSVRYPLTGFGGSAYTIAGIAVEQKIYDPGLAVGWENGTPVAEATRTAQYQTIAQRLHEAFSDLAYAGGCQFQQVDYDWLHLNKRVHLAAVNADGGTLTTGWEALGIPVTDFEIRYADKTTQLIFNRDQLEFMQIDVDAIKAELRVDASQYSRETGLTVVRMFGGGAMITGAVGGDYNADAYGTDAEGRPLNQG